MFSTLRTRFGIPGVISVIALVFAMFGGAYAASNSSGGGKATASAKAKKGPRGPKGATGPAGPVGPAGPAGPQGAKGANGANGAAGAGGKDGTSATTAAYSGEECPGGGVEVKSASPTAYVCNGEDGQTGYTETLPSGMSEHGTWGIGPVYGPKIIKEDEEGKIVEEEKTTQAYLPISFPIPLAAPVPVHYIEAGGTSTEECPGTFTEPVAAKGNLCFYKSPVIFPGEATINPTAVLNPEVAGEQEIGKAGRSGAVIRFTGLSKGTKSGMGVWVVTAP